MSFLAALSVVLYGLPSCPLTVTILSLVRDGLSICLPESVVKDLLASPDGGAFFLRASCCFLMVSL